MTATQTSQRISRLGDWLDDRVNPVVVKELRQAVRSRAVSVILILFLAAQLLAIGIYLLAADDAGRNLYAGQTVFMVLESVLLVVCLLFVPAYVGFRMAGERSDTNVDLVYITTIRPVSILWGKFVSGLVVTALIYSACAPFMVLTYLLRGIDLPSIVLALAFNLIGIVLAMQLALLIGAMNISRVLKALFAVVFFVGLLIGYGVMSSTVFSLAFFGVGSMIGSWTFWGPALQVLAVFAAASGLLFVLGVAVLSPPASNRAMPVRVYVTVSWATLGLLAVILIATAGEETFAQVWFALMPPLVALMILGASGERDSYGNRVRRSVPRRWWWRLAVYPFFSGAGAGIVWGMCMLALTMVAGWAMLRWRVVIVGPISGDTLLPGVLLVLFATAYVLTAVLIRRWLLPRRMPSTVTPALALALAAAMSVIPPVIAFFIAPTQWHRMDAHWATPSPMAGYIFHNDPAMQSQAILVVAIWLGAALVLNLRWLRNQWRQFTPIEPESVTPATTAPDTGVPSLADNPAVAAETAGTVAGDAGREGHDERE